MNEKKGIVKTNRPAIAQSNELTEAAYYLSLQAKRVLWLCLMETYRQEDHPGTFTVRVADYQRLMVRNLEKRFKKFMTINSSVTHARV
ncbi:replication initiation protein, partial [Serratia fonticola]